MMRAFHAIYATALLILGMEGCATVGENFSLADVEKLEPGVATLNDAVALLGPYSSSSVANGITTYGWTYAASNAFTGKIESRAALLSFGADGKLIQRSTSGAPVKKP